MADFPNTSHSLIARVKNLGDGASWTEFLAIYQPVVYRIARRRRMHDADAEDVVQQVFLSIAMAINGWEPGAGRPPFRAWLTTVARNAITKALSRQPRDRATGSTSAEEILNALAEPEITASEVLIEARREAIRWAIDQVRWDFSVETWQLFQETAVDGVSIAEVAKTSGRSVGSIYIARHRVITRIKEKIQELSQLWNLEE